MLLAPSQIEGVSTTTFHQGRFNVCLQMLCLPVTAPYALHNILAMSVIVAVVNSTYSLLQHTYNLF